MTDILANFSAALIFCYFFIKEKVGGSGFNGGSVSTFEGLSRLSRWSNAAAREAGLRFKGLKFKVCDAFAAALDGGTF
jgi:hypothetical protein